MSQEDAAKPKCLKCANDHAICDKGRPCSNCVRKQWSCSYPGQDNLVLYQYPTKESKIPTIDAEEYTHCIHHKRICSGTEPCYRCVKHKEVNCIWKRANGCIELYRADAFTLDEEDNVVLDKSKTLSNCANTRLRQPDDPKKRKSNNSKSLLADSSSDSSDIELPEEPKIDGDLQQPRRKKMKPTSATKDTSSVAMMVLDPHSYKEAIAGDYSKDWTMAMEQEIDKLVQKGVFLVVDKPNKKVISSRWVLRTKVDPYGRILKRKARLMAKGFQQRAGVDYHETFAAVVKPTSFRVLFAIMALRHWVCHQMDVVTAFLNSDMEEEIYISPPPPFNLQKDKVWKMLKNLYGFKQAPRAWYSKLASVMVQFGFRVSQFDPCVFIHTSKELFVAVHVDDLTIFGAVEADVSEFKQDLQSVFEMTDEDECSFYLGMHVKNTGNTVELHQSSYLRKIIERFELNDLPPVYTPCDPNVKLIASDKAKYQANDQFQNKYLSMFGSLNYLPTISRPDLSYAVSLLGRFNSNPNQVHLDALTRVYRYLISTPNLGIEYRRNRNDRIQGYVDTDHAGCLDTRRSTTGWIFILAGGPVSWSAKRQSTVADSTCEAEYVACSESVKEAIWLKGFINDLGVMKPIVSVPIHIDNTSAMKLAKNPEMHQRIKHINIKYHFIREKVEDKTIVLKSISGKENVADLFTKALVRVTFEKHSSTLMKPMTGIQGE